MDQLNAVFLSPSGVEQALSMFDRIVTNKEIDFDLSMHFSRTDWNDFDQIYLDLYKLTLLRRMARASKNTVRLKVKDDFAYFLEKHQDRSSFVKVECVLDIDLENEASPRHLLSEFAVHSLIDFRHAFTKAVQCETVVTYVDVGCIMIAFGVQLRDVERLADFYGVDDKEHAARSLVALRLSTDRWHKVLKQFSVVQQYIDGLPLSTI